MSFTDFALCFFNGFLCVANIYLLLQLRRRPHCGVHRVRHGYFSMSKQLNIGGTSTATVTYTDKAGNTVPPASPPTWSVD